jgi:hypothetical protein
MCGITLAALSRKGSGATAEADALAAIASWKVRLASIPYRIALNFPRPTPRIIVLLQ